jgi:hypothetical protein
MLLMNSILLSGRISGSRNLAAWLVSCALLCMTVNLRIPQDYYTYMPCTQSIFDAFFYTARGFMESTSWIEAYFFFGEVSPSINQGTSLKCRVGFFRWNELPNGVPAVNSMITCPNDQPSSSCYPNALGEAYLNP